jgi:hypothetical protein
MPNVEQQVYCAQKSSISIADNSTNNSSDEQGVSVSDITQVHLPDSDKVRELVASAPSDDSEDSESSEVQVTRRRLLVEKEAQDELWWVKRSMKEGSNEEESV